MKVQGTRLSQQKPRRLDITNYQQNHYENTNRNSFSHRDIISDQGPDLQEESRTQEMVSIWADVNDFLFSVENFFQDRWLFNRKDNTVCVGFSAHLERI